MTLDKIIQQLDMVDHIAEIDDHLQARERCRKVYQFLTDAFMSTNNPVFLDYRDMVSGAGLQINEELQRLIRKMAAEKGSDRFQGVGRPHDETT